MPDKTVSIACDLIKPPSHACKLKPKKVERLAKSIAANGLLQPPGVIATGDRYRIVYGFHRFKAWQSLGNDGIEVRLLPPDTTEAAELNISLQENHVRESEDFEDTLLRLEQVAKAKGCSLTKAAADAGVSRSYVSKIRKINRQLCDEAKHIAKIKRVGVSVLYEVSKAEQPKRQVEILNAYVEGSLDRNGIVAAVKQPFEANHQEIEPKRQNRRRGYQAVAAIGNDLRPVDCIAWQTQKPVCCLSKEQSCSQSITTSFKRKGQRCSLENENNKPHWNH